MTDQPYKIEFHLPEWVNVHCSTYEPTTDLNARMRFVIQTSRLNVEKGTGGPFAAAIFEKETGKLVSIGVNLVTAQGISILHAEMVAIAVAQKKLGVYDLGSDSLPGHELVTSTEPCAMCFGAIPWSGVIRVVTGAFAEDAIKIGFDEGPKHPDWVTELNSRGIEVIRNMERSEAQKVLQLYLDSGGHIYNSRES